MAARNRHPGDLVVADDTGVCFIPRADIMRVLEVREEEENNMRIKAISQGVPVPVFYGKG
jgi:4-hydroxy-4-methyl-2-oxoglutarate aldolase